MSIIDDLLRALIPSVEDCRSKARALQAAHPNESPEQLALRATKTAKTWGVVAGGLSGVVGNPFAMVPAAGMELSVLLRTEARLAGVVAALMDPDTLSDEETFEADVLAVMFPGAVSQALRELGVMAGQRCTKVLIRKYVSKNVLKAVIKWAAKYLGIKLTQRAILSKAVPLVGALIGGTWNWIEVTRIGKRAIKYHEGAEIATP